MITKAQLESLIQREAEKRYPLGDGFIDYPMAQKRRESYTAGTSLLLPALLEAMEALKKYKLISADTAMLSQYSEAAEALQRIEEMLGEK